MEQHFATGFWRAALSAAPRRSNLAIALVDPRKKRDFHRSRTLLAFRFQSRAQSLRSAWGLCSTTQSRDVGNDTADQVSGHCHPGHLEGGVASMPATPNESKSPAACRTPVCRCPRPMTQLCRCRPRVPPGLHNRRSVRCWSALAP